jgi:hypothetical protein
MPRDKKEQKKEEKSIKKNKAISNRTSNRKRLQSWIFFMFLACVFFAVVAVVSLFAQKETNEELRSLKKSNLVLQNRVTKAEQLISKKESENFDLKVKSSFYREKGQDKTKISIVKDGEEQTSFIVNDFKRGEIIRVATKNIYVGLLPENRGLIGYETFSEVYRVNSENNQVTSLRISETVNVSGGDYVYFNDVSIDETKVVYAVGSELIVEDLYTGEVAKKLTVDDKFFHIGGAKFSPSGEKLAFGVTTDYKKEKSEKSIIYTLDLVNNDAEAMVVEEGDGGFFYVSSWTEDESSVEYELLQLN